MNLAVEKPYPEIFLLTGFLGSGKTTLILDCLRDPQASNTGVIVNEIGQADVDGAVITSERSGLPLAVLSNGCVCCSLTGDLPYTVQSLLAEREAAGEPPLERIIVETSGLSRPAPVMRSLLSLKTPVRTTIISTYDSEAGPATTPRFAEAVAQLAAAQTIVLTKMDRVSAKEVAEAQSAASYLNPLARVVAVSDRAARARSVFREILQPVSSPFPMRPRQPPGDLEHERARVFLVRFKDAPEWSDFVEWIENLSGFCGERLLRSKGFVQVRQSEHPILIQGVGTTFDPPRPVGPVDRESAMVVIARDLSADEIYAVTPSLPIQIASL